MQMIPRRLFFEKRGRIKYISHLDTMRAFTRALGRSGLPLWYTEGFNPHLYLTFALPLALGCEGLRESVDIRLTKPLEDAVVMEAINAKLPPGLRILQAGEPQQKPAAIKWADYEIQLITGDSPELLMEELERFSSQPEVEVMKRTKKGEKPMDIRPLFTLHSVAKEGDGVKAEVRLASGIELNINASLWLEAFGTFAGRDELLARICRTDILCEDFSPFC